MSLLNLIANMMVEEETKQNPTTVVVETSNEQTTDAVENEEEPKMDDNMKVLMAKIAEMQERLAGLNNEPAANTAKPETSTPKVTTVKAAKNKRPVKAAAGRKYILLSKSLSSWGRIPQQQADLAKILADNFEVGKEVTEQELFDVVTDKAEAFESLRSAVQDPTYLFAYYRGLGNKDGKHAGFVCRDFIRQIN